MDKRFIILIAIFILGSASLFAYRKLVYKPEGIQYVIKPRAAIKAGDSISYSDQTPGASRWKWDFGDGEYSADQTGYHTFLSPGKYDVTLTAYGPFGVQKKTEVVNVIGSDAAAVIDAPSILGPADARTGAPATWSAGTNAGSYEWKVEGDAAQAANTQKSATATYTFRSAGKRTLVLTTHNPDATIRREIIVMAEQPAAKPAPASASIAMPQQQRPAQAAKPRPQNNGQKPKNNGLEDLGDGVEIEK